MTTPLERAAQAVEEAREEVFRAPNLPAIDRLIRAVRRHDAEILRGESREAEVVDHPAREALLHILELGLIDIDSERMHAAPGWPTHRERNANP